MARRMALPKIGVNMTEAVITKWLVGIGDKISEGDAVLEAETDKSTQEIYATDTGVVAKLLAEEGQTVQCHEDLLILTDEGEQYGEETAAPESKTEAKPAPQPKAETQAAWAEAVEMRGTRIRISPLAKKLAAEMGINPELVSPATPGGRITKADILAFKPAAPKAELANPVQESEVLDRIPMSPMRKTIAARMSESNLQKPCAALTTSADASAILALRDRYRQRGIALSIDALLVKIAGRALAKHRCINSVLEGNEILIKRDINVGVAVDTPKGLMVPVIKSADRKTLPEIGEELAGLAQNAIESNIAAENITGGTFTITNLGMFGVEQFTAVINPPECCILAVGAIKKTFVPDEDDRPVARKVFQMTLVFDHRIVDGAPAAKFLRDFKEYVENPELLI